LAATLALTVLPSTLLNEKQVLYANFRLCLTHYIYTASQTPQLTAAFIFFTSY